MHKNQIITNETFAIIKDIIRTIKPKCKNQKSKKETLKEVFSDSKFK